MGLFPGNADDALLFQLFFFEGCSLHGYLLPPVSSSHGLLLPGDPVVGIHSFLWHHLHWPSLQAIRLSRIWFVILVRIDCSLSRHCMCRISSLDLALTVRENHWRCCNMSLESIIPWDFTAVEGACKLGGSTLAFHLSRAWGRVEEWQNLYLILEQASANCGPRVCFL